MDHATELFLLCAKPVETVTADDFFFMLHKNSGGTLSRVQWDRKQERFKEITKK